MATNLDLSQFTNVWTESFDNGFGMLSRTWGPGVHVANGAVTLNNTPDNQDSGTMVPPTDKNAGNGYGLFSFTMKMEQGDAPGPYVLTWPSTDVWPGPELDMVELHAGGGAYSTIHWKGSDGSNQYKSYELTGVDVRQTHTYAMDWEQGRISFYVDGKQMWTTTDHVPNDAAHGGENESAGVGMQTWWAADAQHGGGYANTMTVYDASYSAPNASYHGGTTDGTVTQPQPPTQPQTPVSQTIGTGTDSLVLKISEQAWNGDAQYTVSVDGKQIGGTLTAHASHAAGQDDTITVKGSFAAGAHKVTVNFTNDDYDHSITDWSKPQTADRNLYLDGASLNGTAIAGATRAMTSAGAVDVAFTKAAAQPGTGYSQTIGTGTDSLVLKISEQAWNGDAQYTVSVDGKQIGGTLTAHASHAAGQDDTITVKGSFAAGAHKVTVNFTNDDYDHSITDWSKPQTADRNLYLDGASLNGTAIAGATKALASAGAVDVAFAKAAGQTIGTGSDSLLLKVSEDAYNGDAQYTVSVDGKQIGGTLTAHALHAAGQDDLLTVKGDFGAGTHKVTVHFLNDAWGGTPDTDRNLYVDGISHAGTDVAGSVKALFSAGTADFAFV